MKRSSPDALSLEVMGGNYFKLICHLLKLPFRADERPAAGAAALTVFD